MDGEKKAYKILSALGLTLTVLLLDNFPKALILMELVNSGLIRHNNISKAKQKT